MSARTMSRSLGAMRSATRVRLALAIVLVLACTGTAQNSAESQLSSSSSAESSSSNAAAVSKEQMDSFLGATFDRLSGGQFVELVDPIMEGQLSRIMVDIKRKYPESLKQLVLARAELSARQFLRILDNLSGGQVFAALHASFPAVFVRPRRASLDTMSGLSLGYSKKSSLDPMSGLSFGAPAKRFNNFDEIDRTGFSGFAKRRSEFDEMDRAGFSGFAKRRSDFDEIDRSGFSGFAKRRSEFDEMDRSGFSGFAKRRSEFDEMDRSGFSGFAKKRFNFDEFDHASGFNGFNKRVIPLASAMASMVHSQKSQPEQATPVKQQTKA